jgi:hypothetical protein
MAVPDAVLLFAVGWAHARIYRAPRLAVDGEQEQIQLEDASALAKRDPIFQAEGRAFGRSGCAVLQHPLSLA